MFIIKHRFLHIPLNKDAEFLIIGTFNPDTPGNPAAYFYGRRQNYLWRLLPLSFGEKDLKGASVKEKEEFILRHHIAFSDLIDEVKVEPENETNYNDVYLDKKVTKWRDVKAEIDQLPNLKKVCFTRMSFSDIPNIKKRITEIENYCRYKGIEFAYLITPARVYTETKLEEWKRFFGSK